MVRTPLSVLHNPLLHLLPLPRPRRLRGYPIRRPPSDRQATRGARRSERSRRRARSERKGHGDLVGEEDKGRGGGDDGRHAVAALCVCGGCV